MLMDNDFFNTHEVSTYCDHFLEFTIPFCISNFNPSQLVKFESDVTYTLEIFKVLTNCDHFLEFMPFCISNFNPSQSVNIEPDIYLLHMRDL